MKADYADDEALSEYLEDSKAKLVDYFNKNYMKSHGSTPIQTPFPAQGTTTALTLGSPQKCFTACYRRRENVMVNELEEYFKLLPEDFEKCDPIKWWVGCHAQFPNLFRLVHDILCIPGMCHMLSVPSLNAEVGDRLCCCCGKNFFWRKGYHFSVPCKSSS
jgi:hAT family C-terminal dimerisation region